MVNEVMPDVFIVAKAIENIDQTKLIHTNIQDLVLQYNEDLSCNKLESSVMPKFATLGECFTFFREDMETFYVKCMAANPYFAYVRGWTPE